MSKLLFSILNAGSWHSFFLCPVSHLVPLIYLSFIYLVIFEDFIYLVLEERKEERERNINVQRDTWLVASCIPPTGDPARNLGMCLNWEWNQWPFRLQASTQSTEPHQPGLFVIINVYMYLYEEILRVVEWMGQCKVISPKIGDP